MDDKQRISTDNSKYSLEKIDSDINDKKKKNPGTSNNDSISLLEKNDSDIDDKKKNKPGTSKSPLQKIDSDINSMRKAPEVIFREPVEEIHTPEDMFQSLLDPSKESGSKTLLKADENDSINDIKEDHKTSKDMSPPTMQDKPDISENIVGKKEVSQSMSHSDSDIEQSPLKRNDSNKTQTSERHSKQSSNISTTQESPTTFERTRQNHSQNGKEDKSFDSIEIPLPDSSSEESTEGEDKKRVSITEDTVEQPVEKQNNRWRAQPRPSSLRRKLSAFEKQLTMDNINKRVTSMFYSDSSRGDSDDTPWHSKDASNDKISEEPKRSYLSPTMASVFIISVATGYSITSLPFYLKKSNWLGVFLIILLGLNAMYSGLCIGWCWLIMQEKWPEYRGYSRIPYQDIGYRVGGKIMKYIVALCIDVSVLLICSVFLILIADSLENIIYDYSKFCYVLIIVTVILIPFTMYSSYKNIKFIAIVDGVLSIAYIFILIVCLFLDRPLSGRATYSENSFASLISSFGGFSFAYGVGPPISNILMDLEDRTMFTNTCATGFLVVILFYVTLAIMGYAAYGDTTTPYILQKILTNETFRPMGIFLDCIFIFQMVTSFIIFMLPTLLQFEVRVNCPDRFCIYRILVRFFVVMCMLALVLGVPYVTVYLEFVGATSINLLTFILPPIFYVILMKKLPKNSKRKIYKKEWFVITESIVLGIAVFIISIVLTAEKVDVSFERRSSCFINVTDVGKAKQWMWTRRKHGSSE